MKYFDKINNRLVFCNQKADDKYWDNHWKESGITKILKNPPKHRILINTTSKFLKPPTKILEGGCGMGDKVLALHKAGYQSFGVDFASKSVVEIKKNYPDLNVVEGDVRKLPFENHFFDGYWSLGVIEHFYEGYDEIIKEMFRVLMLDGYLFLTFPMMSFIREYKAKNKKYKNISEGHNLEESFYQFALDPEMVKQHIENFGLQLKHSSGFDSLKGIKDEINLCNKILTSFIKHFPHLSSISGVLLDKLIGKQCGHMALMIFQKKKKDN